MSSKTDRKLVRTAYKAVSQAHDTSNFACGCFADFATLFHAIADASSEHSQTARLAKIGLYLADDYSLERESLDVRLNELRAALGLSPMKSEEGGK